MPDRDHGARERVALEGALQQNRVERVEDRIVRRREGDAVDHDHGERFAGHVDAFPEALHAEEHAADLALEPGDELPAGRLALHEDGPPRSPVEIEGAVFDEGERTAPLVRCFLEGFLRLLEASPGREEPEHATAAHARDLDHLLGHPSLVLVALSRVRAAARDHRDRLLHEVERARHDALARALAPKLGRDVVEGALHRERRARRDHGVILPLEERGAKEVGGEEELADERRARLTPPIVFVLAVHLDAVDAPIVSFQLGRGEQVRREHARTRSHEPKPEAPLSVGERGGVFEERRRALKHRRQIARLHLAARSEAGAVLLAPAQREQVVEQLPRGCAEIVGEIRIDLIVAPRERLRDRVDAPLRHAPPEKLPRDVGERVRLIDDRHVPRRQRPGLWIARLDPEVDHEEVVVRDDDVGRLRRALRLLREALVEAAARAPGALLGAHRELRAHRAGLEVQLAHVPRGRALDPATDRVPPRIAHGAIVLLVRLDARVVRAPLRDRERERDRHHVAQARQIDRDELFLQGDVRRRDDDALALVDRANNRGHEVRGALAGAGRPFDHEVLAVRDRTLDGARHDELSLAHLVGRELAREQAARAEHFIDLDRRLAHGLLRRIRGSDRERSRASLRAQHQRPAHPCARRKAPTSGAIHPSGFMRLPSARMGPVDFSMFESWIARQIGSTCTPRRTRRPSQT